MSLNDEDRKTLVGLQMGKANRFLEQAEILLLIPVVGQPVPLLLIMIHLTLLSKLTVTYFCLWQSEKANWVTNRKQTNTLVKSSQQSI